MKRWTAHRFGGTGAADAGRRGAVAGLLPARRAAGGRAAVVVPAVSGVTGSLRGPAAAVAAAARDAAYEGALAAPAIFPGAPL